MNAKVENRHRLFAHKILTKYSSAYTVAQLDELAQELADFEASEKAAGRFVRPMESTNEYEGRPQNC